jgi:hypothetical protein
MVLRIVLLLNQQKLSSIGIPFSDSIRAGTVQDQLIVSRPAHSLKPRLSSAIIRDAGASCRSGGISRRLPSSYLSPTISRPMQKAVPAPMVLGIVRGMTLHFAPAAATDRQESTAN